MTTRLDEVIAIQWPINIKFFAETLKTERSSVATRQYSTNSNGRSWSIYFLLGVYERYLASNLFNAHNYAIYCLIAKHLEM